MLDKMANAKINPTKAAAKAVAILLPMMLSGDLRISVSGASVKGKTTHDMIDTTTEHIKDAIITSDF